LLKREKSLKSSKPKKHSNHTRWPKMIVLYILGAKKHQNHLNRASAEAQQRLDWNSTSYPGKLERNCKLINQNEIS
jgi:hypothetical protein